MPFITSDRTLDVVRSYAELRRVPGLLPLLVAGVVARLGTGMTPLALLLLVERASGRYAYASLAVGVYAVAGVSISPVVARLADRLGPSLVLVAAAVVHVVAVAGLVFGAERGVGLAATCAAAAAAGATYPPLTAVIRGACVRLTEARTGWEHLRGTVLAADTALYELVFVAGPLLVGGFSVVGGGGPVVALVVAAGVTLAGTSLVARSPAIRANRPRPAHVEPRGLGPLRIRGFTALLGCVAALGAGFGAVSVAVPAYATEQPGPAAAGLAGPLLAVWGLGSGLGGLWYGARPPRAPLARQFVWLLGCVSVSIAVLAVMPSPLALGVALALGGAVVAPCLTVYLSIVGRIVPGNLRTEAHAWVASVPVAANSVGGAVAGLIVDQPGGVPWAFVMAGSVVAVAAAAAARPTGSITRAEPAQQATT